jgi:tRNA (guanine-N7-)-methyltransferase
VNLKTDSDLMYEFTKEVIAQNKLGVLEDISNVYEQEEINELMQIQTYYEKMWLAEGRTIKFISFQLNKETNYLKPD